MSILKLIGLGLSKNFITEKALEELKTCDIVLFESYTSLSCDLDISFIKSINSNTIGVNRDFIENKSKEIMRMLNEGKKVCIATIGDPMIATTHVSLVTEAKNNGHEFLIVPGISVHCYIISKSMLSSYKFGKSVTVTYPYDGKLDFTPYEVIFDNYSRGLHTILYLDLKDGKAMRANEAIELLLEMEKVRKKGIIRDDKIIVVGQRLGCDDEEVIAIRINDALKYKFKEPPHIIVFPSDNLHFMEVEALKCLMK